MKEQSIYLGYSMAWKAIRLLPEKFAYSLFAFIGKRVHRRNGRLVQRLRSNLARVKPSYDSNESRFTSQPISRFPTFKTRE